MFVSNGLTPLEIFYLSLVGRLGLITPTQLHRTKLSLGSKNRSYETCKDLTRRRYLVQVPFRDPAQPKGSHFVAYKLSTKGMRTLSVFGEMSIRPSTIKTIKPLSVMHSLATNEPIIKAFEVIKTRPDIFLEFEGERSLRATPVQLPNLTRMPDAYVRFVHSTDRQAVLLFEYDRSSIPVARLEERILSYLRMDQSDAYQERFGDKRMGHVCWIVESEKRAKELQQMTFRVCSPERLDQAPLFVFCCVKPDPPAEAFYFDPIWVNTLGEKVSLLSENWRNGWPA
jgi:hypothetical protein